MRFRHECDIILSNCCYRGRIVFKRGTCGKGLGAVQLRGDGG